MADYYDDTLIKVIAGGRFAKLWYGLIIHGELSVEEAFVIGHAMNTYMMQYRKGNIKQGWIKFARWQLEKNSRFKEDKQKRLLRNLKEKNAIEVKMVLTDKRQTERYIRINMAFVADCIQKECMPRPSGGVGANLHPPGGKSAPPLLSKDNNKKEKPRRLAPPAASDGRLTFFTDKEGLPKVGTLIPSDRDYDWADRLHTVIVKVIKRRQPWSQKKWAHEFRLLRKELFDNEDAVLRVERALSWYEKNAHHKKPRIDSARGFRQRFNWIEDEANKNAHEDIKITKDAKDIAKDLAKYDWPKGSKDQLKAVVQISLDSMNEFYDLRKRALKKSKDKDFASYILNKQIAVNSFVKMYLEQIYDQIKGWKEWSGKLTTFALDWRSERFDKYIGEKWSMQFCYNTQRWYDYKKVLLKLGG